MARYIDEDEARRRLLAAVESAGSQSELSRRVGVSKAYISDVIRGKSLGAALLTYLGLRPVRLYERAGLARRSPEDST